jgi:glycerophosphoryl diester phosphodiesterase
MKRFLVGLLALTVAFGLVAQEKIVIAHRGASGYLPEHTLAGYAYAYALGADYLEPDLVMTKDGVLVCLHDIYLERTTDVEEVFPDRRRPDGHFYAIDFTLEELRRLSVHERCRDSGEPYFPGRFPVGFSSFPVPTLTELIELVQGLNRSTGRRVGIYPELKRPGWHLEQGYDVAARLLEVLERYGYRGPEDKVFIQCFEPATLERLRYELGCELPLVQLISVAQFTLATRRGLEGIAGYAVGIGPDKRLIESNPRLVEWAHDLGLLVHPWTFRADSLPRGYGSLEEELARFLFDYGVDGVFTDHPDIAVRVLAGAPVP